MRAESLRKFIPLKDGRTLPIQFRIEHGAVYVVGSAGGIVTAMGGAVVIDIPAYALSRDVGLTVTPASPIPANPDVLSGSVFDFGPGGTLFTLPVWVSIGYDPNQVSPDDEASLVLGHVVGGTWVDVEGSTANAVDHIVTGPISSFSLIAPKLPGPAVVQVTETVQVADAVSLSPPAVVQVTEVIQIVDQISVAVP